MKREKKLTKRERKALAPQRQASQGAASQHIHCIACGIHLDASQFDAPATAKRIRCQHGTTFPTCVGCEGVSRGLLEEHDRTGQGVKTAAAWH